jgi:acetyl esterase/lipase
LPPGKTPKTDKSTPPVFIVHASDDPKAPAVVAANIYKHLTDGGASAELHIFSKGDHGFGVLPKAGSVRSWTTLYAEWLRDQQILPAGAPSK